MSGLTRAGVSPGVWSRRAWAPGGVRRARSPLRPGNRPGGSPCSVIRLVPARVRQIQNRSEAGEEPAEREDEEPEESCGDPQLTPAERQPGGGADRGKHDEHALEEDGDE